MIPQPKFEADIERTHDLVYAMISMNRPDSGANEYSFLTHAWAVSLLGRKERHMNQLTQRIIKEADVYDPVKDRNTLVDKLKDIPDIHTTLKRIATAPSLRDIPNDIRNVSKNISPNIAKIVVYADAMHDLYPDLSLKAARETLTDAIVAADIDVITQLMPALRTFASYSSFD